MEKLDPEHRPHAWGRKQDIIFLALILLSLMLFLALFSYSPNDSAWSVSSDAPVQNVIGVAGALVSDLLLHLVGGTAFFLPFFLLAKLVLLFRKEPSSLRFLWWGRGLGLLVTFLSLSVFAELSVFHSANLPAGMGGILGKSLAALGLHLLGFIGAVLLFTLSLALGLMLYFEFSWLMAFERLGAWLISLKASKDDAPEHSNSPAAPTRIEKTEPQLKASTAAATDDWLNIPMTTQDEPELSAPWQEDLRPVRTASPAPAVASVPPQSVKKAAPLGINEVPIEPLAKRETGVSERVQREQQGELLAVDEPLPSISLLDPPRQQKGGFSADRLQELSRLLVQKLADFGVKVEVTAVAPGPVITRFEIQPAPGVKASKISNLARDLARSMAMISVRVVEVIPGKSVMGIEVPNEDRAIVSLSEVLSSPDYDRSKSPLTLALGHDIGGNPVITDLAKMPHLLVAGTTGSGKSVGVNAMLLSLLFKATPAELRLILVDPKMLELSVYEGIPHLLTPVVTDMKEAASALRWSVAEMERRYMLMSALGVRNLAGYNKKITDAIADGHPIVDPLWKIEQSFNTQPPLLDPLPYIVIVIDEFADMMMVVGKKVEELIARIAQKARAAGIHMILATQRPSVDVITGLIKANIPTRIAFQVSSKIDSRTILDQGGADQLLGHGDMLYMPPGLALPERVHGAFVADDEVHRVVAEWKKRGAPQYIESITSHDEEGGGAGTEGGGDGEQDELYDLAVAFVLESGKCSISSVQRKLRVGYNRAANLVEAMEAAGVVSAPAHNGSRDVLVGGSADY